MLGAGVKTAVGMNDDLIGLNADTSLESCGDLSSYSRVVLCNSCCLLDLNSVLACEVLLENADKVLAREVALLADNSLDIARENINSGNDEHIVLSSEDANPAVSTSAAALCSVNTADIACLESDERTSVLAESGEHELTCLTGLEDFSRMYVDCLDEDMVLCDVETIVIFALCSARTEYIGETVEVKDLSSPDLLDSLACSVYRAAELACNDYLLDVEVLLRVVTCLESLITELPCV